MILFGILRLRYDSFLYVNNTSEEQGASVLAKKPATFKATFQTMPQIDVPQGRNGKHRRIVAAILEDVEHLKPGEAVKIPMRALGDTKENVRAALSRESKKRKLAVATAADSDHLYVWKNGHDEQ
jgi:hypothetical protein